MGSLATTAIRRLGRYDALVLTALLWFLAKFLRYAFPPLFEPLQAAYGVSNTVLGAAFTGFMVVYAAMQFPSGLVADRVGSVPVIAAGAIVAAAAALALVVDAPFLVLVGAMLVMGAGTGAHKTVAVALLSRTYPARTGRALGVLDTFGAFGGVVAPAAVVVFVDLPGAFGDGWRSLFLVGGLAGLGLAATFTARVPNRLPDETTGVSGGTDGADVRSLRKYAALFRDRRISAFVAVTVLFSFAYNGVVAFVPLYLVQEAGLASATANLLYSALFAASLVQLATGDLSDRIGSLPVVVATLGLAAVSLVAVVTLTGIGGPLVVGIAVVGVGLGSHGFRPVRGSYLVSILPRSIAGGSLGVVRTLLMLAGAVAPVLVGYGSETIGFVATFWLLAISVGAATVLSGVLWLDDRGRPRSS